MSGMDPSYAAKLLAAAAASMDDLFKPPTLLPCPFCGSPAKLEEVGFSSGDQNGVGAGAPIIEICCSEQATCPVVAFLMGTCDRAAAIRGWNTRAVEAPARE